MSENHYTIRQIFSYWGKIDKKYGTPCCLAPFEGAKPESLKNYPDRDFKKYKCKDCEKKYSDNDIEENRKKINKDSKNE